MGNSQPTTSPAPSSPINLAAEETERLRAELRRRHADRDAGLKAGDRDYVSFAEATFELTDQLLQAQQRAAATAAEQARHDQERARVGQARRIRTIAGITAAVLTAPFVAALAGAVSRWWFLILIPLLLVIGVIGLLEGEAPRAGQQARQTGAIAVAAAAAITTVNTVIHLGTLAVILAIAAAGIGAITYIGALEPPTTGTQEGRR